MIKRIKAIWRELSVRNKFEILIITFIAVVSIFAVFSDLSVIRLPNFVVTKVTGVEELFFTLFSVQASVSTLSIAIISIINGFTNEVILGVSVSEYISEIKPIYLKHKRLIFADIILTFVNYICVAFELYNISIAVFFVSILFTLVLVNDIYVIFKGKQKIYDEISDYIINYHDDSYLVSLNKEIMGSVTSGNTSRLINDVNFLIELFKYEVQESEYQHNDSIDRILTIFADAFKNIVSQHNAIHSKYIIKAFNEVYEIANGNTAVPLKLDLWNVLSRDYFKGIRDLSYEQLTENYIFNRTHDLLYKNAVSNSENLMYYSTQVYFTLCREGDLFTTEQIQNIKHSMYKRTTLMLFYGGDSLSSCRMTLAKEICWFHKTLIDNNEVNFINKYYFDEYSSHTKGKPEYNLVYFVTLCYLYYLSCRENHVNAKQLKETARAILETNRRQVSYFWMHMDIVSFVKENYTFIRGLMHTWEYMEEREARILQMDSIIDDFCILSTVNSFWNEKSLMDIVKLISGGSMFSLYNRYFNSKTGDFRKLNDEFCSYFAFREKPEQVEYTYQLLLDTCNACYKEELMQEAQKGKLTTDQKMIFGDKISELFLTEANVICRLFNNCVTSAANNSDVNHSECILFSIVSPNDLFQEEHISSYIKGLCASSIVNTVVHFLNSYIRFEDIAEDSQNKQQRLIQLANEEKINGTIVIGNREEFWNESDHSLLSDFTESMKRINYDGGYTKHIIIDGRKVALNIDNISVLFEQLSEEEIAERCRTNDDGSLSYNVTNDLFLPLDKEVIDEYVHSTWCKVLVKASVDWCVQDDIIGVGLNIGE